LRPAKVVRAAAELELAARQLLDGVERRPGASPPPPGSAAVWLEVAMSVTTESRQDTAAAEHAGSSTGHLAAMSAGVVPVLRYAGRVKGLLVGSAVLAVTSTVCELFPYWLVYRLVTDLIAGTAEASAFYRWAVVGVLAIVLHAVLFAYSAVLSHRAAFAVLHGLRVDIAKRLPRLPLGFFTGRSSGDVKKLMIDEAEKLELLLAHGIPDIVASLSVWLGVSGWLFAVDWRLALASVFLTPITFWCMSRAMSNGAPMMADYQAAAVRMNGSIVEYLSGMPVVKVFNRTGDAFAETSRAVRDFAAMESKWGRQWIPFGGAFYALATANIVVLLPVGIWLYTAGAVDLATLLFFVIVGANYSVPLLKLFNHVHQMAIISTSSSLVNAMLTEPQQPDTNRTVTFPHHDVEFDHVEFAYNHGGDQTGEHAVLHGVSFTARTGTATALVGPSGAGKSTLARLIPRFWDLDPAAADAIRIGGHDVRDIAVDQLLDTVAFVFQDTFLFHDTVAANIRAGNEQATHDEVVAAARAARCDEFVTALPHGYDTVIGERGGTLSGGERQRIAIARAILKNAPVVILDEATAFADPENEAAIQDAISALTRGKTLIVIAHRLGTISEVDQIVVLDGGRVVESGRHQDLVAAGGCYAGLWHDYVEAQSIVLHRKEAP
jgi:ATP-binding cassette subfamily B protein